MRIDERIVERYDELSPQERRAADVMLENYADLATYRAGELAGLAGVSKATMSRLFRHLGFDDFDEVREHVRGLRSQGVPVLLDGAPTLRAHLEQEVVNLRRMMAALDESALEEAVRVLSHADRVVVVGLRNSHPVALHLRQQLGQARTGVTLAPVPGQSLADELVGLDASDVVVVVGFRRRPTLLVDAIALLHAAGVPIVLVADPTARALASRVTVWFECPIATSAAFDGYAAPMSLVTLLADRVLDRCGVAGGHRVTAIDAAYRSLREIENG